ncbi:MAG TPA: enoyl-CoA hydratase-related protein [Candidatus Methylomirabilis sp.]|jgi:enoyl-CoA hydratase/carnithine racemase
MVGEKEVLVDRKGAVATVVFNRPAQRNAFNFAMYHEIHRLAGDLEADRSVRVVVFRGAGTEAFAAGADIAEFETHRSTSAQARRYAAAFEGAMDAVEALGKPTIAMIAGACVGGGLEFATCMDLRIAADNSRFGVPIAKLGLLVGYKEMRRLVRLVGPAVAMDLLHTARLADAAEAHRVGLVGRVVPLADLEGTVYGLAEEMAGLAPLVHRWHKQILQAVLRDPALERLTPEEEALPYACFDTADFHEGRRAFLAKRRPTFRGA